MYLIVGVGDRRGSKCTGQAESQRDRLAKACSSDLVHLTIVKQKKVNERQFLTSNSSFKIFDLQKYLINEWMLASSHHFNLSYSKRFYVLHQYFT